MLFAPRSPSLTTKCANKSTIYSFLQKKYLPIHAVYKTSAAQRVTTEHVSTLFWFTGPLKLGSCTRNCDYCGNCETIDHVFLDCKRYSGDSKNIVDALWSKKM